MLYVGERTGKDSSFMRSGAVKALNRYFKTKHNYKFWRESLRPLYESEYYNKNQIKFLSKIKLILQKEIPGDFF